MVIFGTGGFVFDFDFDFFFVAIDLAVAAVFSDFAIAYGYNLGGILEIGVGGSEAALWGVVEGKKEGKKGRPRSMVGLNWGVSWSCGSWCL